MHSWKEVTFVSFIARARLDNYTLGFECNVIYARGRERGELIKLEKCCILAACKSKTRISIVDSRKLEVYFFNVRNNESTENVSL